MGLNATAMNFSKDQYQIISGIIQDSKDLELSTLDEESLDYLDDFISERLHSTDLSEDYVGEDKFNFTKEHIIKTLRMEEDPNIEDESIDEEEEQQLDAEEEYVEEYEEEDAEEEEESEEDEEETPESILFDFIQEIHEELKANPDTDEDYLLTRITQGIKTKGLEVSMRE